MHSLEEALEFVDRFCREAEVEKKKCFNLRLVTEELVVNLLKHGKAKAFSLSITETEEGSCILLSYAGANFNPCESNLGPLQSVTESEPGGLGLFLVKRLSKHLSHRYEKGVNIVQVVV